MNLCFCPAFFFFFLFFFFFFKILKFRLPPVNDVTIYHETVSHTQEGLKKFLRHQLYLNYDTLRLYNQTTKQEFALAWVTFEMAEPRGDAYKKSPQSDGAKREQGVSRAILAALIAALGPVSFGYCIGYSSSALEDLQNADYSSVVRLSADQGSWFSVGSIMSFS